MTYLVSRRFIVFLVTFISYGLYHSSRKTLSGVKASVKNDWLDNTTHAPPFISDLDAKTFLGTLDAIFMGSSEAALYFWGWLGDRLNADYVIASVLAGSLGRYRIIVFLLITYISSVNGDSNTYISRQLLDCMNNLTVHSTNLSACEARIEAGAQSPILGIILLTLLTQAVVYVVIFQRFSDVPDRKKRDLLIAFLCFKLASFASVINLFLSFQTTRAKFSIDCVVYNLMISASYFRLLSTAWRRNEIRNEWRMLQTIQPSTIFISCPVMYAIVKSFQSWSGMTYPVEEIILPLSICYVSSSDLKKFPTKCRRVRVTVKFEGSVIRFPVCRSITLHDLITSFLSLHGRKNYYYGPLGIGFAEKIYAPNSLKNVVLDDFESLENWPEFMLLQLHPELAREEIENNVTLRNYITKNLTHIKGTAFEYCINDVYRLKYECPAHPHISIDDVVIEVKFLVPFQFQDAIRRKVSVHCDFINFKKYSGTTERACCFSGSIMSVVECVTAINQIIQNFVPPRGFDIYDVKPYRRSTTFKMILPAANTTVILGNNNRRIIQLMEVFDLNGKVNAKNHHPLAIEHVWSFGQEDPSRLADALYSFIRLARV